MRRWLQSWCQRYSIGESDRIWHETSILVEVIHLGLTYDQLNLGALASFELAARRLLAIVEHVNGGKDSGNWSAARYLITRKGPGDLMSRELHRHVAEEARVDREVSDVRRKAVSALNEAVASGGLPAAPEEDDRAGAATGRGKAQGRGRGRGR